MLSEDLGKPLSNASIFLAAGRVPATPDGPGWWAARRAAFSTLHHRSDRRARTDKSAENATLRLKHIGITIHQLNHPARSAGLHGESQVLTPCLIQRFIPGFQCANIVNICRQTGVIEIVQLVFRNQQIPPSYFIFQGFQPIRYRPDWRRQIRSVVISPSTRALRINRSRLAIGSIRP